MKQNHKYYLVLGIFVFLSWANFANAQSSETFLEDGFLFKDAGVIYVVEQGLKRPFVSMEVFKSYGYQLKNVPTLQSGDIPESTPILVKGLRHPRGSLVSSRGTVYFIGEGSRYPFPSRQVFFSWGHGFHKVVPANTEDLKLSVGSLVEARSDSRLDVQYFRADQSTVMTGNGVLLTWSVWPSASLVSISSDPNYPVIVLGQPTGVVSSVGRSKVRVFTTAKFTLTASLGDQIVKRDIMVTVPEVKPEILSFTSTASTIDSGKGITLSWNTAWATVRTLNGNPVDAFGSVTYYPTSTTTYTFGAVNAFDKAEKSITITVEPSIKARDSKRLAEIKYIRTVLELYYDDNGNNYPTNLTSLVTAGYLASIPIAPIPNDPPSCTAEQNTYAYQVLQSGKSYSMTFCLGIGVDGYAAGVRTVSPLGIQ